jgi:hypothetical protein
MRLALKLLSLTEPLPVCVLICFTHDESNSSGRSIPCHESSDTSITKCDQRLLWRAQGNHERSIGQVIGRIGIARERGRRRNAKGKDSRSGHQPGANCCVPSPTHLKVSPSQKANSSLSGKCFPFPTYLYEFLVPYFVNDCDRSHAPGPQSKRPFGTVDAR